ncbi:hypothetical protein BDN70DRAFT_764687, partial [Pholiota conissans]
IELKKQMARPSGCYFLGSKATKVFAKFSDRSEKDTPIIIDTGSDITLVSQKALNDMLRAPKLKTGQRINLVQVTGGTTINGYVIMDLIFETDQGPVKMNLEAYVVKGMTTPFILGNDFADQYMLSVVRSDEGTKLLFGNTGRSMFTSNS